MVESVTHASTPAESSVPSRKGLLAWLACVAANPRFLWGVFGGMMLYWALTARSDPGGLLDGVSLLEALGL